MSPIYLRGDEQIVHRMGRAEERVGLHHKEGVCKYPFIWKMLEICQPSQLRLFLEF